MVRFRIMLLMLGAIVVTACTTERKAVKYFNNHPELSSGWCADKYPVRDSIAPPVIKYLKANNADRSREIDSLYIANNGLHKYADSLARIVDAECRGVVSNLRDRIGLQDRAMKRLRDNYKKCEPDTLYSTITVYRENIARVRSLELKLDKLESVNATNIKWKRFFMWWAIGASVVVAVGVVLGLMRR